MFFFFFSSRRRHTRFDCDWSSDVCSSDLPAGGEDEREAAGHALAGRHVLGGPELALAAHELTDVHGGRSEEHTSELQSQSNLVCRLLLEKKKTPCSWYRDRTCS